jgi:hypothetical protein
MRNKEYYIKQARKYRKLRESIYYDFMLPLFFLLVSAIIIYYIIKSIK